MGYRDYTYKEQPLKIDEMLAVQLDSIIYNIKNDWDFVIMLTGDRTVRVGKSVLGMTICSYLASKLALVKMEGKVMNADAYTLDSIHFDNGDMMEYAQKSSPFSLIHYDEGREGLAAIKSMKKFQQDLLDFFAECGQLNHIFVIVCPDFFEMKEIMSVARSECLINVFRTHERIMSNLYGDGMIPVTRLRRGQFGFYSRGSKAKLYDLSKRIGRKSYRLIKPDFEGRFCNQYPIDEAAYKQKKRDFLARFSSRHTEGEKKNRYKDMIDHFVVTRKEEGATFPEIIGDIERLFNQSLSLTTLKGIITKEKNAKEKEEDGEGFNNQKEDKEGFNNQKEDKEGFNNQKEDKEGFNRSHQAICNAQNPPAAHE